MSPATNRACPLCKNTDLIFNYWGDLNLVFCPHCTLVHYAEQPDIDALKELYSADYYQGGSEYSYSNYVKDRPLIQKNARRRIDILRKYKPEGDLLEIGCAHGFFLEVAREYWNVLGTDISAEAVQYTNDIVGVEAYQSDFESFDASAQVFDVIAMWDTIEHLYDPFLAVDKCAQALKPGGILAISTGDIHAFLARLQRRYWRLIHPSHLYYFSRRSISHLLALNGMQVVHFSYEPIYRSLREFVKVIAWRRPPQSWQNRLYHWIEQRPILQPLLEIGIPLNLRDIMLVVAEKK